MYKNELSTVSNNHTDQDQFSYQKGHKTIPMKCFVSHRPPSREGGSFRQAKKKKKEQMKGSGC